MSIALCTPAIVYFVLLAMALVMSLIYHVSFVTIFVKLLFGLGWGWLLNFICSKGFVNVAWFLVLLPYLLILVTVLLAMDVINKISKTNSKKQAPIQHMQMQMQMQQQPMQMQMHR